MKRRRQKNNPIKLIGLASALVICLGARGFINYMHGDNCPFIVMIDRSAH